jgi:hypothetical protein
MSSAPPVPSGRTWMDIQWRRGSRSVVRGLWHYRIDSGRGKTTAGLRGLRPEGLQFDDSMGIVNRPFLSSLSSFPRTPL